MRIVLLLLGFVCLAAVSVFAADGSAASFTLPTWAQAILAICGAGTVGGTSIFAIVANKIEKIKKIVQDLKDFVNATTVYIGQIKSVIETSPLVACHNAFIDHAISLLKDMPLGISNKANLLATLKITLPIATPAIIQKAEAVAAKVEQVVDKAADVAAAIPQAAPNPVPAA
jgi:hypothetical protein